MLALLVYNQFNLDVHVDWSLESFIFIIKSVCQEYFSVV